MDDLKENLCLEKGITLIIIPYNSYKSDETLLQYIIEQIDYHNIEIELSKISLDEFYKGSQVLDELRSLAKTRNGKLISNHYVNDKTKLTWQCSEGHLWESIPNNIKNNSWCPYCSGLKRKSIQDMVVLAELKGGKCLSTEYKGNKEKLKWQCSEGHIWEARPDSIVVGKWCPECSGKKLLTIEDMHVIAEKKGGKCLSTVYYPDEPMTWQCSKGHVWEAPSNRVRKGQWCRKCSGHQKLTIEEMQEIAKSRGGECLSEKYKDNKTKLKWKCSVGHEWEAIPNNIKSKGHWCPKCSRNEVYK